MRIPIHRQDLLTEQQACVVLDLLMDADSLLSGVAEDAGIVIVDDDLDDKPFPDCD